MRHYLYWEVKNPFKSASTFSFASVQSMMCCIDILYAPGIMPGVFVLIEIWFIIKNVRNDNKKTFYI